MDIFIIRGRLSERQTPSLFHFLEPLDLRSLYSRAVFCRLVDRAVALTAEDKLRYDAASLGILRRPATNAKPRRFKVVIARDEQPETFSNLHQINYSVENHSGLLHLLEVAAGLLILESMRIAIHLNGHGSKPDAGLPPSAYQAVPWPPSAVGAITASVPVALTMKTSPLPVPDQHGIISSSADYGEMSDVPADDLRELMG
ncbi:MAG: hypothetical protein Q8M11_22170 [Sulfuritalea sp.]|nr:hypothetical protein [Sulfuritalea sp.]